MKQIFSLVRNPLGRLQLLAELSELAWPTLRRVATSYRWTLARKTRIVAVVGSFGKSTTMRAVTVALGRSVHRRAMANSSSNVAKALLRIRPSDRHAVIEVGIAVPGQMAKYARIIQPDITVVTSIGSDHNRSLKTLEVTRSEKAEMVRILPSWGIAVLNGDDSNVLWMRDQTCARVITFGFAASNDVHASDVNLDWPSGIRFTVHAASETRTLRTQLMGKHMVYPILAAVAVSLAEGLTFEQIIPALEALRATPGRMELIRLANGGRILRDDYKSGLETIDAALDALAEIPAQRRVIVMGEISEPPGSQGQIYRRLGERVGHIVSLAIFVGASSAWSPFATGVKRGGLPPDRIINAGGSVRKSVEVLRDNVRPDDVVLVKGRGNQRLERVVLGLMGRVVDCDVSFCNAHVNCSRCPMLVADGASPRAAKRTTTDLHS